MQSIKVKKLLNPRVRYEGREQKQCPKRVAVIYQYQYSAILCHLPFTPSGYNIIFHQFGIRWHRSILGYLPPTIVPALGRNEISCWPCPPPPPLLILQGVVQEGGLQCGQVPHAGLCQDASNGQGMIDVGSLLGIPGGC